MQPMQLRLRQNGISLLEVLIALLILSLGALGFAGLQLKGLRTTEDANYRAHATLIAQDAIERILSNPAEFSTYLNASGYAATTPGNAPPNDCVVKECDALEMAIWDKSHLSWTVANALPNGRILISECDFNDAQCVTVSWSDTAPSACTTSAGIKSDTNCLVMEVVR